MTGDGTQSGEWQAETLRVSAFSHQPTGLGTGKIWERLAQVEPLRSATDPRTSSFEESGPCPWDKHSWLVTRRTPGRLDVLLVPVPPEFLNDLPGLTLRQIGQFSAQQAHAVRIGQAMLGAVSNEVTRLAFGATLLMPVDSLADGYLRLGRYLPSVAITSEMRNLSYQVNRPRDVTLSDGTISVNRFQRWSVLLMQQLQFVVQGDGTAAPAPVTSGPTAVRVELDVNTDGERSGPLPTADLTSLVQTLATLSSEIAERGDVP